MQTFLPYADFYESASVLDYRRLGKQRVEGMQLIKAIEQGSSYGWYNHPCTQMWLNNLDALKEYTNSMIDEWVARGYKNTMAYYHVPDSFDEPFWLGFDDLHISHQSNLIRKLPDFYRPVFGNDVPDNLEYLWPGNKIIEGYNTYGKQSNRNS